MFPVSHRYPPRAKYNDYIILFIFMATSDSNNYKTIR